VSHWTCTSVAYLSPGRHPSFWHMRSSGTSTLDVPRTRTAPCDRSFAVVAGPRIWNSLPAGIRDPTLSPGTFATLLKTYTCLINGCGAGVSELTPEKCIPCHKQTVQTYFLSAICQISTDCENFWHKDSKDGKLF